MRVSLHTDYGIFTERQGFWYAAKHITETLNELGIPVSFNDPTADVMFNFCQPQDYVHYDGQYTIGYTPWESTGMTGPSFAQKAPNGIAGMSIGYQDESKPLELWPQMINETCDEFWTTNHLGMRWFREGGVDLPGLVYPHGIDHALAPVKRGMKGPITFLHIGEPAPRKGGQMVFEAFKELFADDPNYRLIIKGHGSSLVRDYDQAKMVRRPDDLINNVHVITRDMELSELQGLYASAHCLVYPSWGEGFGFIPLQALGTGLPTIMTTDWCDYALPGTLRVKTNLVESPWQDIHPGKMFEPDYDSLKHQMREFAENRVYYTHLTHTMAPYIHEENDWKTLTQTAFKNLLERFS